jgi:hypothetical protein
MASMQGDNNVIMTGEEMYPVIGFFSDIIIDLTGPLICTDESRLTLSKHEVAELMKMCKGLNLYWNCLEKAILVRKYMGRGVVCIGQMYIWNSDFTANFGYGFNLPYEFHAWWQENEDKKSPIIDIALPGVVLKGSKLADEVGPIIVGREPAILVGYPHNWMVYERKYVIGNSVIV